jgi:tetratricopeptide (TPR) repeat protein
VKSILLPAALLFAVAATTGHAQEKKTPPLTMERVRQALDLAKLAAENGMQDLSLRAVRDSLAGGPPINPIKVNSNQVGIITSNPNQVAGQQLSDEVQQRINALDSQWRTAEFDPAAVYEALREVILPEARPNDVLLYARTLDRSNSSSRSSSQATGRLQIESVADQLVDWSIRAAQTNDLTTRIAARAHSPQGRFNAAILMTKLKLQTGNEDEASNHLQNLHEELKRNSLEIYNELGAHVALAAIDRLGAQADAVELLEKCASNLAVNNTNNTNRNRFEAVATLLQRAGRARLEQGNSEAAYKLFRQLLTATDAHFVRYSGDYPQQQRATKLSLIGREYLRANRLSEAFKFLEENGGDFDELMKSDAAKTLPGLMARSIWSLKAEERFDFLKTWCFPKESGGSIREVAGFVVPPQLPPEFAELRAYPEDAESLGTLPISADVRFFSTTLALIDSAEADGKLDELRGLIQEAKDAGSNNADTALELLSLKRLTTDELQTRIQDRAKWLGENLPNFNERGKSVSMQDVALAAVSLNTPEVLPHTRQLVNAIIDWSKRLQKGDLRRSLWALRGTVELAAQRGSNPELLTSPDFDYWVPAGYATADEIPSGIPTTAWVAHENMIKLHTGSPTSQLIFRYPLTGSFTFSSSISDSDWSEGYFCYNGVNYTSNRYSTSHEMVSPGRAGRTRNRNAVWRDVGHDVDYRMTTNGERTTFAVNGHVVLSDDAKPTSPWLGLAGWGGWTPIYRQLRLSGNPLIPREVPLLNDSQLRGWNSSFYGESTVAAHGQSNDAPHYDWTLRDGVLYGQHQGASRNHQAGDSAVQSRFYYQRPLLDGERISYEFHYVPGSLVVHPAIGRLAFLIKPAEVALHWITDGEHELSGLSAANQTRDAGGQLVEKLPLKINDWNAVTVAIADSKLTLTINGTAVYERRLAANNTRLFSFFRFADRSDAEIRNAVLTGDWPEQLPAEATSNLLASSTPRSAADLRVQYELLGADRLSRNALDTVRAARKLPDPESRFTLLSEWVLPSPTHTAVRIRCDSVAADDELGINNPLQLVSPAYDLVDIAAKLNRLDELRTAATAAPADGNYQTYSRLGMLALIELAAGNFDAANRHIDEFAKFVPNINAHPHYQRLPILTVGARAILHPESRFHGYRILRDLGERIQSGRSTDWQFDQVARTLRGTAELLIADPTALDRIGQGPSSKNWFPVTHSRAMLHSGGVPRAHWEEIPGGFRQFAGHWDEFMYYRIPLTGNFQVDAEVSSFGWREARLMYGGQWVGPNYTRKHLEAGGVTHSYKGKNVEQPLQQLEGWFPYRLVVKDGQAKVFVSGQEIREFKLAKDHDPWLGFALKRHAYGSFRNVRITGQPEVPATLNISRRLRGTWVATYFDEQINNQQWHMDGDVIVGSQRTDQGAWRESLLQYHRPLIEDCELSYEFLVGENTAPAHRVYPTLGRTAFILSKNGVQIHKLTGAQYETTGLTPDNLRPAPGFKQEAIPLKHGDWNSCTIRIAGDMLALSLNGKEIGQHSIEPDNSRVVGLFHWMDRSEARARNISLKGGWPTSVPSVEQQELVARKNGFSTGTKLPEKLSLDFTDAKTYAAEFRPQGADPKKYIKQSDAGVALTIDGQAGAWKNSAVALRQGLKGDFDITLSFADVKFEKGPKGSTVAGLAIAFPSAMNRTVRIARLLDQDGKHYFATGCGFIGCEKRQYHSMKVENDCSSGRVRLLRRNGMVYAFGAAGDSEDWVLVDQQAVGTGDVKPHQLTVLTACSQAPDARAAVTVKSLDVAAQGLVPLPQTSN